MVHRGLVIAILVLGGIHLATLQLDYTVIHWVFKLLPMLLIIVLALRAKPIDRTLMYKGFVVAGLLFSMAGDAFLLNAGDRWFMFGLAAFLIGHLLYIAAMLKRWRHSWLRLLWTLPIGAYSWFVGSKLHESITNTDVGGQSDLWMPVLVYLCVIAVMCWLAIMSRNGHAAAGAVLFVLSDSTLAWNKFVSAVPAAGLLIMFTYFAAQLLIAGSIANIFASKKVAKESGVRM